MNNTPFDPKTLTTKYVFFTGKGGVGKTSLASATAIHLAKSGKRVCIVSTDPASNLDDVFQMTLGAEPTPVSSVKGLFAANLDPEEAAKNYREKVIAPYRGVLPDAAITSIEEQLSGACTVEIAAFDEFAKLLAAPDVDGFYDHVILDTAPTGHTLRLLQLPKAWSGFLEESTHGASCLGPLSGLGEKKDLYADTVAALANRDQTTIVLVARPDHAALIEAARASSELQELGISNQWLIINGYLTDPGDDVYALAYRNRQDQALADLPLDITMLPTFKVPLNPRGLIGVQALATLLKNNHDQISANQQDTVVHSNEAYPQGLTLVIEDLAQQQRGVIMTMGKGGVGKTTMAAAIAIGLAEKGLNVHLTTTDPAAHLDFALGNHQERSNLKVARIDPKEVTAQYKQTVLSQNASQLDKEGLALLEEDLASPCTEEIAVFRAFAETVEQAEHGFVVLDTAPTGHTLLLLDAAEAYHREVLRSTGDIPEHVRKLLPRLRNPNETHVILVTLPEATPVLEAERLQSDLQRAGISPHWWIVNQSWSNIDTSHPVLSSRARSERDWINYVQNISTNNTIVSWCVNEPVGEKSLLQLAYT
ncbi:MAG: arsenical pump-driving ATPase [Paenibacillaceae bacterium]|jgi:arsenite-transporting ATPase|nr:arsenical pump-driving ATPase [Paenibacillaceae bacterium]